MKRKPFLAGILSLFVPGLGQMYAGRFNRGATILVAAIIVANLNLIFLQTFISTNPGSSGSWMYWLPRIGHDVVSAWSIVFWIWTVVDAYRLALRELNQ